MTSYRVRRQTLEIESHFRMSFCVKGHRNVDDGTPKGMANPDTMRKTTATFTGDGDLSSKGAYMQTAIKGIAHINQKKYLLRLANDKVLHLFRILVAKMSTKLAKVMTFTTSPMI